MASNQNNGISELRDALFAQLKNLQDDSKNLEKEIMRAEALVNVGKVIVDTAKVEVAFMHTTGSIGTGFIPNNKLLGDGGAK